MRPAESGALTAARKYFLLKYSILGLVDLSFNAFSILGIFIANIWPSGGEVIGLG